MDRVSSIDESVKEELLRYPTVDLIRALFPDVRMKGRSVMCNPLRGERHASLSCFRDRNGYPRWKDHATGESGDNIDFFRLACPGLSYVESVDRMAVMLLGRSACIPGGVSGYVSAPVRRASRPVHEAPAESSALSVVSVTPVSPGTTPAQFVDYWRRRGISDAVAVRYLSDVVYENSNAQGRTVLSSGSGLPVVGSGGELVLDDGRREALGLPNGIGGWSLRSPDSPQRKGFKGCTSMFPSLIRADGTAPVRRAHLFGKGDALVGALSYDPSRGVFFFNGTQGFSGVDSRVASLAWPFFEAMSGRRLEGRDATRAEALLDFLSSVPMTAGVAVVEGMFDALSLVELARRAGGGTAPGMDLVVLNSVSNIGWAVPVLASYGEVLSYLDNDMRTGAGKVAFRRLSAEVSGYAARLGRTVPVRSCSSLFQPYKDVNDYLRMLCGFDVKPPVRARAERGPALG